MISNEELEKISKIVSTLPEDQREAKARELLAKVPQQSVKCPFCLMAEKKIKTVNVYEDELFLGVLEINPANPGHILLFPKKHILNLSALTDDEAEKIMKLIKNMDAALLQITEGTNVYTASDQTAGQAYDHLVVHVIPRYKGDKVHFVWEPTPATEDDLKRMKDKILAYMPKKEMPKEPIAFTKPLPTPEERLKGNVYY